MHHDVFLFQIFITENINGYKKHNRECSVEVVENIQSAQVKCRRRAIHVFRRKERVESEYGSFKNTAPTISGTREHAENRS